MACVNCSSFDPNYHGGYCDYNKRDTSPNSSCSHEDSRGGGNSKYTCDTCRSFDPNYHGGYCDYHKCDTYPSSTCSSHEF